MLYDHIGVFRCSARVALGSLGASLCSPQLSYCHLVCPGGILVCHCGNLDVFLFGPGMFCDSLGVLWCSPDVFFLVLLCFCAVGECSMADYVFWHISIMT